MQKDHDNDRVRVHDMLEAAQKIQGLLSGCSRQAFDDDETLQLALRYLVLMIGEAAYNVSPERRAGHPKIPWAQIIGMRHRLVHGYSAVDLNILWIAATENVPRLIANLGKLLEEDFGK